MMDNGQGSVRSRNRTVDWAQHRLVWVDSERVEACMRDLQEGAGDGVAISPAKGYALPNVEFLRSHAYVKGVVLPDASGIDISPIECLTDLEFLSVAGSTQPLDLTRFPCLRETKVDAAWAGPIQSNITELPTAYALADSPNVVLNIAYVNGVPQSRLSGRLIVGPVLGPSYADPAVERLRTIYSRTRASLGELMRFGLAFVR